MEPIELTDEQRVVIFLALRMTNPRLSLEKARSFMYHVEIEEGCFAFWSAVGVKRSRDTWIRACRRAMGVSVPSPPGMVCKRGMLGNVVGVRVKGQNYYRFNFDRGPDELLRAAGQDYVQIAHGNRAHEKNGYSQEGGDAL